MAYTRSSKRQFQPPISSFFSASTSSTTTTTTTPSLSRAYSDAVSLPEHVQANLLSVGMRVRKAVPEGYKNLESKPIAAAAAQPEPCLAASLPAHGNSSTPSTRRAELLPFCGIHKTGGLLNDTAYATDEFAFPASSQDSFASAVSIADSEVAGAQNVRKRGMVDEFDDFDDESAAFDQGGVAFDPAYFDERLFGMLECGGGASVMAQRPIARATTRRHGAGTRTLATGSVDDFDEADFLKPGAGDVDMEG